MKFYVNRLYQYCCISKPIYLYLETTNIRNILKIINQNVCKIFASVVYVDSECQIVFKFQSETSMKKIKWLIYRLPVGYIFVTPFHQSY